MEVQEQVSCVPQPVQMDGQDMRAHRTVHAAWPRRELPADDGHQETHEETHEKVDDEGAHQEADQGAHQASVDEKADDEDADPEADAASDEAADGPSDGDALEVSVGVRSRFGGLHRKRPGMLSAQLRGSKPLPSRTMPTCSLLLHSARPVTGP